MIRFCKKLGFSGFSEFKAALRLELSGRQDRGEKKGERFMEGFKVVIAGNGAESVCHAAGAAGLLAYHAEFQGDLLVLFPHFQSPLADLGKGKINIRKCLLRLRGYFMKRNYSTFRTWFRNTPDLFTNAGGTVIL